MSNRARNKSNNANVNASESNVAKLVNALRIRDAKQAELDQAEKDVQAFLVLAANEIPSVRVVQRTWNPTAEDRAKGYDRPITGETIEGQARFVIDGMTRIVTFMSRVNKGLGCMTHSLKGWNAVKAQEEEIASYEF